MKFKISKNPNEQEFIEISEAVVANDGYCPCLLNKNEDTKCMCKDFRDSEDVDFCHCGRYYKTKEYETIAIIGDISEGDSIVEYVNWCEKLAFQDFIVYGLPFNLYSFQITTDKYRNLCKTIISKADALIVLDCSNELQAIVEEYIYWAKELGKKVLTAEDLRR